MAKPQDPQQQAAMIDGIAAKAMGVPPQQAQQPAPQAPTPEPKDSKEDKAQTKGSPDTEGDKISAEAIIYEVDFGEGNNRKLTPQQIKSTFERYGALNHEHAKIKPIMDVIRNYMKANPGTSSKEVAETLANLAKGGERNPTMGNTDGKKSQSPDDMQASLKKWEEDNAASLPPGYAEMMMNNGNGMSNIQSQLQQTQQMLQQVLANSAGVADAARAGVQGAQNQQIQAVQQQIANNIDRVQQAIGLPDSAANDFMVFAGERGYTLEDFVDPQLTIKVMQDFKNNMNSPEMDRMKAMAERRQAYTGSLGSTPSATPSPEGANPQGESTFDKLSASVMSKRGLT
tara:strand:- start:15054 stop:16082 length:1029 start_codon:yes stop_codon:yes gene_type:complete